MARLSEPARFYLLAGAGICLFVEGGLWLMGRPALHAQPREPAPGTVALPVRPASPVTQGYPGILLAQDAVDVAATKEGLLTQLSVGLGAHVDAGQLLGTVNAEAEREDLALAEAQLDEDEAGLAKAKLERERAEERLARDERIAGNLSAAELSESRYGLRLATVAESLAQARVRERTAVIAQAKAHLSKAELRAPFSGVISARFLAPGAHVQAGSPVLRVLGEGTLQVRFAVPGEVSRALAPGQTVQVEVAGGEPLSAEVERVAPEVDAASRTVTVEAVVKDGRAGLLRSLAGTSVRVQVPPSPAQASRP
jgi:membrane fusion protein (multidrug efflux system)/multidrug efflux system membrane fusion protein